MSCRRRGVWEPRLACLHPAILLPGFDAGVVHSAGCARYCRRWRVYSQTPVHEVLPALSGVQCPIVPPASITHGINSQYIETRPTGHSLCSSAHIKYPVDGSVSHRAEAPATYVWVHDVPAGTSAMSPSSPSVASQYSQSACKPPTGCPSSIRIPDPLRHVLSRQPPA